MTAGPPARPLVVAHRGYSAVAPENTLPALVAAGAAGADLVEFDVRTTADGVPMVIHDRTVDRTTNGSGRVQDLGVDEIERWDAGSWFSPAYAGIRVPRLSTVLDVLGAVDVRLLVEIKPPATAEQVKVIVAQLADRGLSHRSVVQSFDPGILHLVDEADPRLRRGLLRSGFDADPVAVARDCGATLYNPSVGDVCGDPAAVGRLRDAGVEVMPWTANDPAEWPALLAAGVAGMITDRPGALAGWRGSACRQR